MKWQLIVYFVVAVVLSTVLYSMEWVYLHDRWTDVELWSCLIGTVLFVALAVGYLAAKNIQRKVDELHLGLIQLSKGNLSNRIPLSRGDSFEPIYADFNEMAQSIEQRVKLLQTVGEENVMLQVQSNEAAVIEERRRLARDLHDTVSQQLFAIHMTASSLPNVLEKDRSMSAQLIDQLIQISQHAQKQMRGLIAQLRPIELQDKTLKDALHEWFPDYCRQNGLQGTLDIRVSEPMSEAIEHQMFLLIQEGLANTVKHSGADRVTLTLHDLGHQYILHIYDNGSGFDLSSIKTGSYGLSTMKERAQKLGGDFDIMSIKGSGTRIEIRIPKFKKEAVR